MSATPTVADLSARPRTRARAVPIARRRPRPELAALVVLAGALNLWGLSRNAWANDYYSAAVRSMSASWHNFLFASFDPQGVMSVDKPPLALWVQTLSVKLFGFHSLSILVPQALMGVASTVLLYDLTRRRWGRAAGFIAGAALASTPITVAISRHNNPDALLILCSVAAVWGLLRALEDGRTRWLMLCGASVGLGFETKMAAALLVVPGIVAAWLWVAPRGHLRALRQLAAGGLVMLVVGGAWPLLVTLTPAADRPWVSGTNDNSIVSLISGYNGLGRLEGQSGGPASFGGTAGMGAAGRGGAGVGGSVFGGEAGALRLFNESLGGQAGWLVGFALAGSLAIALASRLRRKDPRTGWVIALGGAFVTCAVAFSSARGIFHPYYVSLLAPFTAALIGAGVIQLSGRGLLTRILGVMAVGGGVAGEVAILRENPAELSWLVPTLIVGGAVLAVGLLVLTHRRGRAVALAVAVAMLSVAPATWAVQTLGHATSGTFPAGGPSSSARGGGPEGRGPGAGGPGGAARGFGAAGNPSGAGRVPAPEGIQLFGRSSRATRQGGAGGPTAGFGGGNQTLTEAVAYVAKHGGGTIATSSQSDAAAAIIGSEASVAGIGGFSGRESEVSLSWFAQEIRSGHIRWVLTGSSGMGLGGDQRAGATVVMAKAEKVCRAVSSFTSSTGELSLAEVQPGASSESSASGLYDCSDRAGQLEA